MTLRYYLDDDVGARPVAAELRLHGIDIVRSTDVGMRGMPDPEHLAYASADQRVLITANRRDFVDLHWQWQVQASEHAGIVILKQRTSIGTRVRALTLMNEWLDMELIANRLEFLDDWIDA